MVVKHQQERKPQEQKNLTWKKVLERWCNDATKKEFKKEYAPFYRYKCKKTLTRGQVRASLVTISEISPSVDALK